MLSGIGKYLMVRSRMKTAGLEYVVVELLCWLNSFPDSQACVPGMCHDAADLYCGISAEEGREDCF